MWFCLSYARFGTSLDLENISFWCPPLVHHCRYEICCLCIQDARHDLCPCEIKRCYNLVFIALFLLVEPYFNVGIYFLHQD